MSNALRGQTILVISRHFPPINTGGSRRSALLVTALESQGAQVCVAAPMQAKNPDGSPRDMIVVPHPQAEPSIGSLGASGKKTRTAKAYLRRNILLPDPDIRWVKKLVKAVLASGRDFDWVLTTSPPESIHYAGYALKHFKSANIRHSPKWIADFRDFWIENALFAPRRGAFRGRLDRSIARKWLVKADLIIAVSSAIAKEAESLSGQTAHFIAQITRKPDAYINLPLEPDRIHIAHTGSFSLSDSERHITDCLDIFDAAHQRNPALKLHLAGRLTVQEQAEMSSHKAANHVVYHGLLSPEKTLALQTKMQSLFVFSAPNSAVIPGKYYEYKRAGRPVIYAGGPALMALGGARDPVEQMVALSLKNQSVKSEGYGVSEAGADLARLMLGASDLQA